MALESFESSALRSKSLTLLDKLTNILEQLDDLNFPSETTKLAKSLLTETLNSLAHPERMDSIDPHSLFRTILNIQSIVENVRLSHIDHVSWPIVGHCDKIWHSLFGDAGPFIFYSTTPRHNYSIFPFSGWLLNYLHDVLPKAQRDHLIENCFKFYDDVKEKSLYCLHLSSLEDDNIPLYANIAHEFGHALYNNDSDKLRLNIHAAFSGTNFISSLLSTFSDPNDINIQKIIYRIILKLGQELFADLFAIFSFGPAFYLSFYELSWGNLKNIWSIALSPHDYQISAYPSVNYRISYLKEFSNIHDFIQIMRDVFAEEEIEKFQLLEKALIPEEQENKHDSVMVSSIKGNGDCVKIKDFLTNNLGEIKVALNSLKLSSLDYFKSNYPHMQHKAKRENILKLLKRISSDIPPNIITAEDLLGEPADFECILLASALYRLAEFSKGKDNVDHFNKNIKKIGRLTMKAFEVVYVQKNYNRFVGDSNGSS